MKKNKEKTKQKTDKKQKKEKKQIIYRTKEERQLEVKEILNQLSKFDLKFL